MIDTLLSEASVSKQLGISSRSLARWRTEGGGPDFVRTGKRKLAYSTKAIEAWLASRTFAHRAAEIAGQAGVA